MLGRMVEEWRIELRQSDIDLARRHASRHECVGREKLDLRLRSLAGKISFRRYEESTGVRCLPDADADTFGISEGGGGQPDDKAKRDGSCGQPGFAPPADRYHRSLSTRR